MFFQPSESPVAPTVVQVYVDLAKALVWPLLTVVGVCVFYKPIRSALDGLQIRISSGDPVEFGGLKIGSAPSRLPTVAAGGKITSSHMALVHSSWRYPKMDAKYGMPMWAFHVVIQAPDEVLDRIESAKYLLDPAYDRRVYETTDRASRFKLKELANGESTVRCEVKVKDQDELIHLDRYINLTDTGPRI
jgi:hypothetical protein